MSRSKYRPNRFKSDRNNYGVVFQTPVEKKFIKRLGVRQLRRADKECLKQEVEIYQEPHYEDDEYNRGEYDDPYSSDYINHQYERDYYDYDDCVLYTPQLRRSDFCPVVSDKEGYFVRDMWSGAVFEDCLLSDVFWKEHEEQKFKERDFFYSEEFFSAVEEPLYEKQDHRPFLFLFPLSNVT